MAYIRMENSSPYFDAIISSPLGIETTLIEPPTSDPQRSRIESLPYDILLLFADLLDFQTVVTLLSVSTAFRSLARRIFHTKKSIQYQRTKRNRFYDECLDSTEDGGGREAYMGGGFCWKGRNVAHWEDHCPCVSCCEVKIQVDTRTHRAMDDVCIPRPWKRARFTVKDDSYVRLLQGGFLAIMGDSLFDPPVKEETAFRLMYKFYCPETDLQDSMSPWGDYAPHWSYQYELREAGIRISPKKGEEYISVGRFCDELERYTGMIWRWEERLEIISVTFHQEYHSGKPNIDVMLNVRLEYEDEEYFDYDKQEYHVPLGMQEYEPSEDPKEYSDSEDEYNWDMDEQELQDLKADIEDWNELTEDQQEAIRKAVWGDIKKEDYSMNIIFFAQRTRGL